MQSHKLTSAVILAYLDGDVDERQRSSIDALLASDPQARERVQQLQHLRQALQATLDVADTLPAPRARVWHRIRAQTVDGRAIWSQRRLSVVITLLAVIMLTLTWVNFRNRTGPQLQTNQQGLLTSTAQVPLSVGMTVLPLAQTHPTTTPLAQMYPTITPTPGGAIGTTNGPSTPLLEAYPIPLTGKIGQPNACTASVPLTVEGAQAWISDATPTFNRPALLCVRFVRDNIEVLDIRLYLDIETTHLMATTPRHEQLYSHPALFDPANTIAAYPLIHNQIEPTTPITVTVDVVLPDTPDIVYRTMLVYSVAPPSSSDELTQLRETALIATVQRATQEAYSTVVANWTPTGVAQMPIGSPSTQVQVLKPSPTIMPTAVKP